LAIRRRRYPEDQTVHVARYGSLRTFSYFRPPGNPDRSPSQQLRKKTHQSLEGLFLSFFLYSAGDKRGSWHTCSTLCEKENIKATAINSTFLPFPVFLFLFLQYKTDSFHTPVLPGQLPKEKKLAFCSRSYFCRIQVTKDSMQQH
jgi:hypothetical protein